MGSVGLLNQHLLLFNGILSLFSPRNFTSFSNYEYGNCYVFGDENMNVSAPGNQNGELLHSIMYNHLLSQNSYLK